MSKKIKILITMLGMLVATLSMAQDFSDQARENLSALSALTGTWKGNGWSLSPKGEKTQSNIQEEIRFGLDSTILQISGLGKREVDGELVTTHEALGVIYYDVLLKKYFMESWIALGMHTKADFEILSENELRWSFSVGPQVRIRYTLQLGEDTWNEIGEMSNSGSDWRQFFEMNLTKTD